MGKKTCAWLIIEANSLLDDIMGRDNNISHLFNLADEGKIEVKTSEISYEEVEFVLFNEVMYYRELASELEKRSKDLKRGRYATHESMFRDMADNLRTLSSGIEKESNTAIDKLKRLVDALPFDGDVLADATRTTFNPLFGLELADAVHFVTAKNTGVLKPENVECMFFTKDKHFDNELIRKELAKSGISFYTKSGECVKVLREMTNDY